MVRTTDRSVESLFSRWRFRAATRICSYDYAGSGLCPLLQLLFVSQTNTSCASTWRRPRFFYSFSFLLNDPSFTLSVLTPLSCFEQSNPATELNDTFACKSSSYSSFPNKLFRVCLHGMRIPQSPNLISGNLWGRKHEKELLGKGKLRNI